MLILFCSDPFETKQVDESFAEQAQAAIDAGGQIAVVHLESLVNEHAAARAVKTVAVSGEPCTAIYRGWMVTPDQYAELHAALRDRGVTLINNPEQYRHCHWLPECYGDIAAYSPKTIWLKQEDGLNIDRAMAALREFDGRPVIVKDYVKSQKHYWHEACFVPNSSDRAAVERVVTRFLELQGEDLAGGLVFREYVPLRKLTDHSRSGMPLSEEYRVFILDGRPIFTCNYWEEGEYDSQPPDLAEFADVMNKVPTRFFTMDIARTADGQWIIVELGDGQVSGLQTAKPADFYAALVRAAGAGGGR